MFFRLPAHARSTLLVLFGSTALGCNAVFGWDEATLDPLLGDAASDAVGREDAGAGEGGGGADGAPAVTISCETYCSLVQTHCTGPNAEYGSREVCLAMCGKIEPGFAGETTTNTVACRQYHAAAAANDPGFHCRHAGPLGGEVCGSDHCDSFCLLTTALCRTQPEPPYASESACRTTCKTYKYLPDAGDLGADNGDSLNCRHYHLQNAYASDPSVHCPHTGEVSATCQ